MADGELLGTPKATGGMPRVSIRVPVEAQQRFEAMAGREGISVADAVRDAAMRGLDAAELAQLKRLRKEA